MSELSLEASGESIVVKRVFEDGWQRIRLRLPCLITSLKDMNKPRYMSVPGVFEAYAKTIRVWKLEDIDVDPANVGLKGSPTRVRQSFTKGAKSAGKVHEVDAAEGARIIVERLKEKFIL